MSNGSTGATYVADGITARPVYDYTPPPAFFEAGAPPAAVVIDIRDFGAVEGAGINCQPMIQAAVEAAHKAGGGIVYIPPGVWGVGANSDGYGGIHLADNVFIKGAGMGLTSVRLMDGSATEITGIIRTPWGEGTTNCGVADLSIDGNRANTTGKVDGFYTGPIPGATMRDSDIHVLRVEIHDVSRYAFDPHEQTERLAIKDSVAHHNGYDGFTIDYNVDAELTGNVAYANGRHGFNLVTTAHDILMTGNVAHGNGGAGFAVQRGSENIEGAHSITITGGASWGNAREGVLVQMSHDVVVSGMEIHGNGREGVRILGSSHVTISDNVIEGNSQALNDGYSEVTIAAYNDTLHGRFYEASANLIQGNTIRADGDVAARYGVEERAVGTAANIAVDNDISGTVRGPIVLNGAGSYTMVKGGDGDDTLVGTGTKDSILGGAGVDSLSGQDGNDLLDGGIGNDKLLGGKGLDKLEGGEGDDYLNGNSGDDTVSGGSGADTLLGDSGNDWLSGGDGNDTVSGGSGNDVILADAGDDVLNGGSGYDLVDFSAAPNAVMVDLTAKLATGIGNDTVASFEAVLGSAFADMLKGDRNTNTLTGGAGDDTLRGMGGADTLTGGSGADTLVWGSARDVVDSGLYLGLDHATDFAVGEDVLDMRSLAADSAWTALDDIVQVSDAADGTIVSINIGGVFHAVVQLDGLHGHDAASLTASGTLLL